jgi:phage terminase small subunit
MPTAKKKAKSTRATKLSSKQKLFVAEYLVDRNASRAAIAVGYSARSAREIGYEVLTRPHIKAEVARQTELLELNAGMRAIDAMNEVRAIATGNLTDGMEFDKVTGMFQFKDAEDIPPEFWKAAQSVETFALPGGGVGVKVRLANKLNALKMEYDRHQLVQPAVNQTTNIASMHISLLDQNKAMKRVGESEIIDV